MKINKSSIMGTRKRVIIFLAVAMLLIAFLITLYTLIGRKESVSKNSPLAGQTINYVPATEQEKKESEAQKDAIIESRNKQKDGSSLPESGTGRKNVTPIIILAQYSDPSIEVRAFVPGIYESTGSCTLTLTQGVQTVTKTVKAIANASTTDCQQFLVNKTELTANGTWSASVAYLSATAEGKSTQNTQVEVK